MAQRGNRPKDPAGQKGGVRGTHGLGDAPREAKRATHAAPRDVDEGTGEEHDFAVANAMAGLESEDDRAERRETEAQAALDEGIEVAPPQTTEAVEVIEPGPADVIEGDVIASEDVVRARSEDAAEDDVGEDSEAVERKERGLDTVRTPGPGPKDAGKGRARTKHLEDAGLTPGESARSKPNGDARRAGRRSGPEHAVRAKGRH
jgi:hypothetical protein